MPVLRRGGNGFEPGKRPILPNRTHLPADHTRQHPAAAIKGFVTEHGSVYAYAGKSAPTRFKVSGGEGRGELIPAFTACVFVDEAEAVPRDFNAYHLCYRGDDGRAKFIKSRDECPIDKKPILVKIQGRKIVDKVEASFTPTVGLVPIEKWFSDDLTETKYHIGHKVTEVMTNSAAVMYKMHAAGKTFNKDASYFAQIAEGFESRGQPR